MVRRRRQAFLWVGWALMSVGVAVGAGQPGAGAPEGVLTLVPGARVWLHAHNCYPDAGRWADRLPRALATGVPWLAIEQDLAWIAGAPGRPGRSVVAHDTPPTGDEPGLEAHFFARVLPILDRAVAENRRDTWPVLVVSFDFKTNEPEHHQFVWDLLGRYERYLTTAIRTGEPGRPSPFEVGPLLVLTESGPGQEDHFFGRVPVGGTLRLFGTVPPPDLSDEQKDLRHTLSADTLVPSGANDYRRWVNFPWSAVEAGGPNGAGVWTAVDEARLRSLVARAHDRGLWIRFYTLNGYGAGNDRGWSDSYNFGSADAVRLRWKAAQDAGVDFVATDQYETFAAFVISSLR